MLPEGDVWTALDSQPDPPAISFIPGYIQDVESSLSSFIRFEGADADLELPSTPPAAVLESDHCQIHDELYVNTHKRRKTLLQLPTAAPRFFFFVLVYVSYITLELYLLRQRVLVPVLLQAPPQTRLPTLRLCPSFPPRRN
jgi:hypothetical protein